MKIALSLVAVAVSVAMPAVAQDLPTDQLERHADVVRQDSLLRSTLRHNQARRSGPTRRATPEQTAACAKKGRFRSQFGADHPKVRRLYDLCAGVGL